MQETGENKKTVFVFADAVANAPQQPPTSSLWYISETLDWIMNLLCVGMLFMRRRVDFDFYSFIILVALTMYVMWGLIEFRMYFKWKAYRNLIKNWINDHYALPNAFVPVKPLPQNKGPRFMSKILWGFVPFFFIASSFDVTVAAVAVVATDYVARVIRFICTECITVEEVLSGVIEKC